MAHFPPASWPEFILLSANLYLKAPDRRLRSIQIFRRNSFSVRYIIKIVQAL